MSALDAKMARRHLDTRLQPLTPLRSLLKKPSQGWIRSVRQALGMTSVQLARRMGVSQPTILDMEASESADRIQLKTLRRAAEALDCELFYVLVPKESFEGIVEERAMNVAGKTMTSVTHSMRLEAQEVDQPTTDRQLRELAESVDPKQLWND